MMLPTVNAMPAMGNKSVIAFMLLVSGSTVDYAKGLGY